jgi:hypothetical protein
MVFLFLIILKGLIIERIRAELRQNGEKDTNRINEIKDLMNKYQEDQENGNKRKMEEEEEEDDKSKKIKPNESKSINIFSNCTFNGPVCFDKSFYDEIKKHFN